MTNPPSPTISVRADRFEMLDLLRGIAAFAVLAYHSSIFLGFELVPNAYVAVDLFFMLSGFVISHNYDLKIKTGMTFREFMLQRFIRLYPCYVLAFVLGVTLGGIRFVRNAGYVDPVGLAGTALPNLAMLPALTPLYGDYSLYPYNGASWTLLFELAANIIYWLIFRVLNGALLAVLLVIAGTGYVVASIHSGTVDFGMRSGEIFMGLSRVTITFFIGLALRRYVHNRLRFRLGPAWIIIALCVLIATFYSTKILPEHHVLVELLAVLVIYPTLLTAMSNTVPGRRLAALCRIAGDASYPIYILQNPLFLLVAAIPQVAFHHKAILWAPAYGFIEVASISVISWYVSGHIELPLRRRMKTWLLPASASVRARSGAFDH